MLNLKQTTDRSFSNSNISLNEKQSIFKINLRGDLDNKDFTNKTEKMLGILLPKESGSISSKENRNCLWLGPNEWLIVSNDTSINDVNGYKIEKMLFDSISKTNLGAITNVTEQLTIFNLSGSNIIEVLSKSSPFDFENDKFRDNSVIQTLLNNVDVIVHRKKITDMDLYVRRSFSSFLWSWILDSIKYT